MRFFFAWHGAVFSRQEFGKNFKMCSDQWAYQFKISDAITGNVNFENVIKQYCLDTADEQCDSRLFFGRTN